MQASINRSVSRSKEIVYDAVVGEDSILKGVIVENNKLLVICSEESMDKSRVSVLKKMLAKARNRDGISSHVVMTGHVLKVEGKELVVSPAP